MKNRRSLLIVDDDSTRRETLCSLLRRQGYSPHAAETGDEALELARDRDFEAILGDLSPPDKTAAEMLGELRAIRPDTPILLMVPTGDLASTAEAMRAGALATVAKPLDPESALLTLERALERRAMMLENRLLRRAVDRASEQGDLVGESTAMREIFALIRSVAHSRSCVLITGESGTDKEGVARTIHYQGNRANEPFVPINCGALPSDLLASELFGHVRGAFAGAHASKRGLLEHASRGTLFLNEVGDLPLSLQGELLRVLRDREIRPLGGIRPVPVDTRIIAATNRDLRRALTAGEFRQDLYYRLNVVPIRIPPLRERPEDIPHLVRAFLERHCEDRRRVVSAEALQLLKSGEWRGNIRELENVIERAIVASETPEIQVEDLPVSLRDEARSPGFARASMRSSPQRHMSLREVGDLYISEILRLTGGNKVQAAKILGVDRKTLYRRAERSKHHSTAEGSP